MDLKQLEYIVAIANHGNISQAAYAMFVTPSGLNQQLKKLEDELGVQLFYRDKHNVHLTEAGRIYVDNARVILRIKKNTYTMLNDLKGNTVGTLNLGLTHEHGIDLFTSVFPSFNKKYPGVTFNLTEGIVDRQHELIKNGSLDFGIVMMGEQDKINLNYIKLYNENLILGVSRKHPLARFAAPPGQPLTTIDLKEFRKERFSLIFASSTMRKIVQPVFDKAGFQPHLLIETAMNHALVKMVAIGLCCTIIPESRAFANPMYNDQVAWFYLESRPNWNVYIACRKDIKLSAAAQYFIKLAQEYGATLSQSFYKN